ncbi:MAG: PKD domain-containing protein [Lewinella sp.]|nr:PKD domain-containing protein [Lewinella sp.]
MYTLTYSAGAPECPNAESITLEIRPPVSVELTPADPACESLTYVPVVNFSGEIDSYQWTFAGGTPGAANTADPGTIQYDAPGTYPVIIQVDGDCGMLTDTITLDIQSPTDLQIDPVNQPLCSGSSPDTLLVNAMGGQWTGMGITNTNLGIFDPGAVTPDQTYTLVYTLVNGACIDTASIDLEVVASQVVIAQDELLCEDSAPLNLTTDAPGGTWQGPGITDANLGTFDPADSGTGTFSPIYSFTDPNGCEVTTMAEVIVEAFPILNHLDTVDLCLSNTVVDLPTAFAYEPVPGGGQTTWAGPGVLSPDGSFNSVFSGLPPGLYPVVVQYERNECLVVASMWVRLVQPEPLSLIPDQVVCISEGTLTLTANLAGGDWSGPGIDSGTGEIDLAMAGAGVLTYDYLYQAGTTCEQAGQVQVEIIDLSQVVQAGPDVAECEGPNTFTLTGGSPADGEWMGAALLNAQAGTIDLSQITPDSLYTYQYCVESELVAGCSACAERSFILHARPVADFTIDGIPCIGETFTLVNGTTNAVSYAWDFGDNNNSTDESPTYSYTSQGTYTLSLIATSEDQCRDTISQELYITTPPMVAFDLSSNEGCAPFFLELTNSSSGDSISQVWYIAGDTIPGVLPGTVYLDSITQDSLFPIVLSVSNFCGEVTQTEEVLVHPYPIVNFGMSVDEGCSPVEVDFANTTLGQADSYSWDMGNGAMYTDSLPPSQVYTTTPDAVGVYTITLAAQNECGQDTLSREVTVFPPDVDAFIALDTLTGCQPLTIQPESFSTPGSDVSWIVTDEVGNVYNSNQANPTFTLTEPGLHTIILLASKCGTDSDTAYVEVEPAPEVSFTHRPFICLGEPVQFTNASVGISESLWDFGDGNGSMNISPVHVFDSVGTFVVTLTGYSLINNCPTTVSSEIIVVGNPTAAFTPSTLNGCAPLTVAFANESTGNGELNYVWQFADGSSASLEENPVHTFQEPGNYPVRLITYDQDSCFSDTTALNIFVYDLPVSAFTLEDDTFCHRYDSVALTNTSVDAVSFTWELPDQTLTTVSPIWLPTAPGDFTVTLIAENIFGCRDTSAQNLTVLPSPMADFTINVSEGCEDLLVEFDNASQDGTSYLWTFGDGAIATDLNPTHLYLEPGTLTPQLVVRHTNGCPADTAQAEIQVRPTPVADFTFAKPEICGAPITVTFTNTSVGSLDNNWTLGDGALSDQTSPIHTYNTIGAYPVLLVTTNEFGCADSTTQLVDIYGDPLADFALSVSEGCEDLAVDFLNTSLEAQDFHWTIESFPPLTEATPSLVFTEPGVYDVQLIAVYNELCQDTLSLPDAIRVYDAPLADFTYEADESAQTIGDVRFINLSADADRFLWDLGDGTLTDVFEPVHEYDINRSVLVTLTAYNDNDGAFTCIDTLQLPVDPEWITTFYAPNAFAPTYGEGDVRVFKPVGLGIEEYEISVFSPWGELVWHSTELENNQPTGFWDGMYNGQLVPQGAYVWLAKLTFVDGTQRIEEGTVTVLR